MMAVFGGKDLLRLRGKKTESFFIFSFWSILCKTFSLDSHLKAKVLFISNLLMCQISTGLDVWKVVRRDGGQVDGKWMADA
jgi:hypothetical protein